MNAAGREALLAGDAEGAMAAFAEAVAEAPSDFRSRYWLAAALMQAGEPAGDMLDDARTLQALSLARSLDADLGRLRSEPGYAAQVASQLYARDLVASASVAWGMAISGGHVDATALVSYGLSLQHQGRADEACDIFKVAAETFASPAVHQFLLFPQLFLDDPDRRHAREARAWAERWAKAPAAAPHANPAPDGRRLRIGYVAPNFASSQLRQFITPVLENHGPGEVAVTLYPADAAADGAWPAWIDVHPIGQLADADAAALIRRDGIDVLVDCWGPTAGSRLGVFAHRPAPVQTAWINFIHTTGLPQMDYVLHGGGEDAPDVGGLFTEQVWRHGPVFTPFRPSAGRLDPGPTPAKAAGVVTFGSFNHPAKLSDGALAAWATVLRNAPDSRLLLKYRYYDDPVLQSVTQTRFAAHGVAPERIVFAGHTSGEDYFRSFQQVDLMLDGWPAPGSTTSLEALSNGAPVLTMVEPQATLSGFYARRMLEACGLPDLVATSPEAFVAKALELASDIEALDAVRARVRPGFDGSPYRDEAGFTRRLEDAFRQMFDAWRARLPERGAA